MEAIVNNTVAEVLEPKKSGRGQYEHQKRGNYKNDKKITVKLFLNKRLKPEYILEKVYYPLYIQVSLKSQSTVFPATINGQTMTIEDTGRDIDFKDFDLDINYNNILEIIEILQPFTRQNFRISELSLICTSFYSPLYSVIIKSLARTFNMISSEIEDEDSDGISEWFGILQIIFNLKEDENIYSKIDQELWYLEEYSKLIEKKLFFQDYYKTGKYGHYENISLTLIGYLKGDFQKLLINEIGEEKANKIFNSIDFILETYFCKQIDFIKYLSNKFDKYLIK